MKTLEIEIPKGHEIDKEKSTFEKIVFKEVKGRAMKWEDLGRVEGFYYDTDCDIHGDVYSNRDRNKNVFPTRQDAESSLALSQLLQLRKNWVGDWEADWEADNGSIDIIIRIKGRLETSTNVTYFRELSFPTELMATDFLAAHEGLIKVYFKL